MWVVVLVYRPSALIFIKLWGQMQSDTMALLWKGGGPQHPGEREPCFWNESPSLRPTNRDEKPGLRPRESRLSLTRLMETPPPPPPCPEADGNELSRHHLLYRRKRRGERCAGFLSRAHFKAQAAPQGENTSRGGVFLQSPHRQHTPSPTRQREDGSSVFQHSPPAGASVALNRGKVILV